MKIPKVNHMKNFNVNDQGFYGRFGGAYVPEILHANVENYVNVICGKWKMSLFSRSSGYC